MNYIVSQSQAILRGNINLPPSKSISHRLLMIEKLLPDASIHVKHLSESNDTQIMQKALQLLANRSNIQHLDMQDAGTPLRFLTAYAATQKGTTVIDGCTRMRERPIGTLVKTLRALGANISYGQTEGFPPLIIEGKRLKGGNVEIEASVSSQFISALMLIAPVTETGVQLHLKGKEVSSPYTYMTAQLMQDFGFKVERQGKLISIPPQSIVPKQNTFAVESDWSAASYWYQMAALSEDADLWLYGLKSNSLQGDALLVSIFDKLGVTTCFHEKGVHLKRKPRQLPTCFSADLTQNPDLVQTIICTLTALQVPCQLSGVDNLRLKETDRLAALKTELEKLNCEVEIQSNCISTTPKALPQTDTTIHTYQDHRMAMAFTPFALVSDHIIIQDPECVKKSYPLFWKDIKACGFEIKEIL